MNQSSPKPQPARSWRGAFVTGLDELRRWGGARLDSAEQLAAAEEAHRRFGFLATDYYLGLADGSDPKDPILAQILPDPRELEEGPAGYCLDAVGDLDPAHHKAPGLVHKYPGRALLVTNSACPVHCRYCFRRSYPYQELRGRGPVMKRALEVIREDPSIREVILSGGDPLSLSDDRLVALVEELSTIAHLRRIRIHSRFPVVLPERIDESLLERLTGQRLPLWLVTHFNHPRELTEQARACCQRLLRAGIPVLNQSVLLAGVNDDPELLAELFEGLVDLGVKPYYLHQLDRVEGVAHFEVPEASARALFAGLRSTLSGIALPAFVRDLPGRASKTPMLALLVLLSGLALFGCSSSSPAIDQTRQPTPESEAGGAKSGTESVASVASESVSPAAASMVPMSSVDRVLSVDVRGGGAFEVLAASGAELRLGPWPAAAGQPRFRWSYRGQGMVQTWLAEDLDGDGKDELVVAFGQGRGFPKASLEVVLFEEQRGQIVSKRLTLLTGARNQATALAPWRRDGDGYDLYLAAFESRFVVRGGVLSRAGGEPDWLPGHSLRMGMARAVGDFDGDGRSDVAVGRLYGDQKGEHGDLRVLLGERYYGADSEPARGAGGRRR
ncbi:MAG: hypothetical protein CMP23_06795 [Rickettsiales bacterium]|nr:hypothetical protein [Rickettsiales bacterium]